MSKKKKFYAVAKGRHPGIYQTWDATQKEVNGFPSAKFKGFVTQPEAKEYLKQNSSSSKTSNQHYDIQIYSDGGSRNHGNRKGGHVHSDDKSAWAYLIQFDHRQFYGSDGEFGATNNRMEIMGFLNALKWLQKHRDQTKHILAVLDSKYVLNAVTKHWLKGWKKRGWKTATGGPVKNAELWKRVDAILPSFRHLDFHWTKGHANNDGNNFVDRLLNETMDKMKKEPHHIKRPVHDYRPKTSVKKHHNQHYNQHSKRISTDQSVQNLKNNFKQMGLF
ncbi:ribonuclease H [Philodulcilactobacillus myokoensis]|uniref:Ribonuclease H n=1 Tax=Philodulcilactobacillus myokoensis TaxID=2929573 RepID=A0A9W6B061_9LACO|nr:ribonuclease H family protein [Philodulcilactobacillus myokoensis]GLB46510.1 ribonuclease H [Philodulcilactobacillus myokoensis]